MEVDPEELVDPFQNVQVGDAQRDAIRVGDMYVGAPIELSAEQLAEQAEAIKLAALRSQTRELAIERGRRLGVHEASLRKETGTEAEHRISRAMAYAAWEYDGKPLDYGNRYQEEFKVPEIPSFHAGIHHNGPDPKAGKRK